MLKINHLRYECGHASYTFDFNAAPLSRLALVGPSGVGKTTCLNLISGLQTPLTGSIDFQNQNLNQLPLKKRPLAYLFQMHHTFEHLSAYDNIKLGLYSQPKDRRPALKALILNLLHDFQMDPFKDQPVSQLSGGQRQRVALMRTIIQHQPLWLLDEPFNGLDMETKQGVFQHLIKWQKALGATILFTTHHTGEINGFATHQCQIKTNGSHTTNSCVSALGQRIVERFID